MKSLKQTNVVNQALKNLDRNPLSKMVKLKKEYQSYVEPIQEETFSDKDLKIESIPDHFKSISRE